jgi:small subunit ribosomal protein S7
LLRAQPCRALSRHSRKGADRVASGLANSEQQPTPLVETATAQSEQVIAELKRRADRITDSKAVVGEFPFYAHAPSFRRENPALQERLARQMMYDGKKSVAERVLCDALALVGQSTGYQPGSVLALAVENATPLLELRGVSASGGRSLQVPTPVAPGRAEGMAIRWLIAAARKRSKGQSMHLKLAAELTDAAKGEGSAVKKRIEQHKDAERNKVNAHLRSVTR